MSLGCLGLLQRCGCAWIRITLRRSASRNSQARASLSEDSRSSKTKGRMGGKSLIISSLERFCDGAATSAAPAGSTLARRGDALRFCAAGAKEVEHAISLPSEVELEPKHRMKGSAGAHTVGASREDVGLVGVIRERHVELETTREAKLCIE